MKINSIIQQELKKTGRKVLKRGKIEFNEMCKRKNEKKKEFRHNLKFTREVTK